MAADAGPHVQPVVCVRPPAAFGELYQVASLTERQHSRPPKLSTRMRATRPTRTRIKPVLVLRPRVDQTTPSRSSAAAQATIVTPPRGQSVSFTEPRKEVK